jgi:hypothetical protein
MIHYRVDVGILSVQLRCCPTFLLHKQDCQDGDYANAGTQGLTTQKLEMAVKKDTLSENKEG